MGELTVDEARALCDYIHHKTHDDRELMRAICASYAVRISELDPSLECGEIRDGCVEFTAGLMFPCSTDSEAVQTECTTTRVQEHLDCLEAFTNDLWADFGEASCDDPDSFVEETPSERWQTLRDEAPGCQALRESCPVFFDATDDEV